MTSHGMVFGAPIPMARHQRPLQPQRRSTSAPADSLEPYKSPRRKLLRFFEKSRDQWKAKCLEAKATVKRLQNRVRFLEKSKDRLQHRVSDLEADVETLKHLLQVKDNELADVKKNRPNQR
jgi:chromosome segregation ATPase